MKQLVILALVAIGLLAVSVYRAKLGANEAEGRILQLEAENASLREEVRVLRAEEAHLSRPERIGPIARDQLGMGPVSPDQVATGQNLKERLGSDETATPVGDALPGAKGGGS